MANGTQRDEVLKDPKFFGMSESDQVGVLSEIDPQFKSLPERDKRNILKMRVRAWRARPAPAPPAEPAPPPKAWYEKATEYVGELFKRAPEPTQAPKPAPAPGVSDLARQYFERVGIYGPKEKPPVLPPTPVLPPDQQPMPAPEPITTPPTYAGLEASRRGLEGLEGNVAARVAGFNQKAKSVGQRVDQFNERVGMGEVYDRTEA
ncbi:MAG TPA: hypothetical protein VNA25_21385, partial [Phycisphaerae bacterium]|nr:hypothetical protein [Phycisphaerae bacterium]